MIQRKAKEPTLVTMISTSLSFSLASTGFCKIGWYCEKKQNIKKQCTSNRASNLVSHGTRWLIIHHFTSPRLLRALVILEAVPVGTSVPDAFNHAWQILDERPDELQCLALQVVGQAMSLCPIPVKSLITKTRKVLKLFIQRGNTRGNTSSY